MPRRRYPAGCRVRSDRPTTVNPEGPSRRRSDRPTVFTQIAVSARWQAGCLLNKSPSSIELGPVHPFSCLSGYFLVARVVPVRAFVPVDRARVVFFASGAASGGTASAETAALNAFISRDFRREALFL
jgi:hypothetical protein